MNVKNIEKIFSESIDTKQKLLASNQFDNLVKMGEVIANAIQSGGKILLCGNGGSAADAQHLAAEMLVRLRPNNNREAIPALALAQDTSTITACGNDFGYDCLFERMVRGLGKSGDVLIGFTTSGNSENILRALKAAKELEIKSFGFLGSGGGKALSECEIAFLVPSNNTGRIQESHITAGHALMEFVEDLLLEKDYLRLEEQGSTT
jgi:D-sedoheptulose 7-phosphate isomerase